MLEGESSYIEFKVYSELRVLNIWTGVIKPKDAWIFSYIETLHNSNSDFANNHKFKGWILLDTKNISTALPILELSPETIRKRVGIMANAGLLQKKNKKIQGSNRILIKPSKFYNNALYDIGCGLTTEQLKKKYFPDGFVNLNKKSIEPPANIGRIEIELVGQNWPEDSKKVTGQIRPDNITVINNYKRGYKDNSINTRGEVVDNSEIEIIPPPEIDKSKPVMKNVWEFGYYHYASFELLPAVRSKIKELIDKDFTPEFILKSCRKYLNEKKSVLYVNKVVGLEFIDYLDQCADLLNPRNHNPEPCPCCGRNINAKGICGFCSYDINETPEWQEEHLSQLKHKVGH